MDARTRALVALLLALPTAAAAAPNDDARIVLHVQTSDPGNTCTTPVDSLGLDCDAVRPTVTVGASEDVEVYVYLQNYESCRGAQMAFEWDSSWTFMYWAGSCQSNEVLGTSAPQASGDSYIGAFDVITGGTLAPLGRMRFTTGATGTELTVVETWAPGGTGLIDDALVFTTIPGDNRGIVAVDAAGGDACGGESKSRAFF